MSGSKLLLILGSGFSKAVFPDIMPTVKELAPCLEAEGALRQEPYKHLVGDPELLLTYLSLAQPWKTPAEALNDEALFIKVANRLADYIARCEDAAFKHSVPGWASDLVQSLHEQRVPVISLNYDTIIERLLKRSDSEASTRIGWPHERDLYGLPLSPLGLRESGANQPQEIETSRLIKLHGSINWFYSGAEGWPGEQVYFRPVDTDSPLQDGRGPSSASNQQYTRLVKDKIRTCGGNVAPV